jgi:beta-lactamase superfamily II metal-dependent hydrolase
MTATIDPPAADILELSIFGGGVGESIVLHVGAGVWIVVDSCVEDGASVPLAYLTQMGIDVEADLALIICSHAHDDHIKGIAQLYEAATSARLGLPSAASREEFAGLVELDAEQLNLRLRVLSEYNRLFRIMNERPSAKRLWLGASWRELRVHLREPSSYCRITALTPSDEDVLASVQDIGRMWPEPGSVPRQLSRRDPNHFAMAVHVTSGERELLLGSDVLTGDPTGRTGWSAVVSEIPDSFPTCDLFKVSHHGSETGHHEEVWGKLVSGELSVMTPFVQGKVRLPTSADIERLRGLSERLYVTGLAPKMSRGDHQRVGAMGPVVRAAHRRTGVMGHVRARAPLRGPATWTVDTFGPARQL